ncbi:MAG TPA: AMP-binding protein [Nocardioidaceae bacterium]|nr:AMP-binding protein [Nocardioidaceae bacterium]
MTDTEAPVNVADLLRAAATSHPDKVAVVDDAVRTSYRLLDEQVDAFAAGLAELGLVAGNRVAIAMGNSVEFVVAYLAAARSGVVAVPLNSGSTVDEVARVLADSGARLCVADADTVAAVRGAAGGALLAVRVVVTGVEPTDDEVPYSRLLEATSRVVSPRDREALAVLMYTSGTSGRPRGAMLSNRALVANIEQAASTDPPPLTDDDVVLGVVPMSHIYGLNAILGQVIRQQSTLVVARRFSPDETLRLIGAESVTVVPVAPPAIGAWSRVDGIAERLSSVRTLLSGAGPLAEATVRGFEELTGLSVEQGYGLTEAAPMVTTTLGAPVHKPGSAGRAVPGVRLRVVDDVGRDAEHDDPGEILVQGDNVFSGYWPDGDSAPDPEGWLSTGDIGFLDADGDLYLVDRLKEVVIVSGFNVYPSEIEEVIAEIASVRECAVIGVADDETGESVAAYVVASDGAAGADELAAEVIAHCESRLARFKLPSTVNVVDELPHSATGKVAKGRLRAAEARRALGLS